VADPEGLAFNEDKTPSSNAASTSWGFNARRYDGRKLLIRRSQAAVRRFRGRLAAEVAP